jgi:predicted DNA binding CopG/RHH family protein
VTIAEVEAFLMGTPRIAPDYRHSGREQRYLAVGRNGIGRAMFVAFTIRIRDGEQFIRRLVRDTCMRRKSKAMKKVPHFKTDEEAEAFLDQDLSDLDFSQFKPVRFEFLPKEKSINLRLSEDLLTAVRARAKSQGIPYQRYIRQTLERAVTARKR